MNMDKAPRPVERRPAISAHRGGSENAPAATLEAYKSAVSTGAEYVEFDIRRTKDGTLVVYHEERVNHTGPMLGEISYQELCEYAEYQVPKVDEVMELIAGRAIGHLDLKEVGYEEEVIEHAISILGEGNFVATSLEDVSIARIKQKFPQVRTALSLGRDLDGKPTWEKIRVRWSELFPLRRIRDCGTDWVAVNHKLARLTVLRICTGRGINAMVWTVNEEKLIESLLADRRVEVLITDRPQHAVSTRAALSDYHL
jgi:glycerophosphoryl diester phosphodiesterase